MGVCGGAPQTPFGSLCVNATEEAKGPLLFQHKEPKVKAQPLIPFQQPRSSSPSPSLCLILCHSIPCHAMPCYSLPFVVSLTQTGAVCLTLTLQEIIYLPASSHLVDKHHSSFLSSLHFFLSYHLSLCPRLQSTFILQLRFVCSCQISLGMDDCLGRHADPNWLKIRVKVHGFYSD